MPKRILVVDDEQPARKIVMTMLKTSGYLCRAACNGVDALAILDSGAKFDLVLSGLLMPEMDGASLLINLRDRYPNLPFVMVTAVHDEDVAREVVQSGALDYLRKPFDRDQLLDTVRRALEARQKPDVEPDDSNASEPPVSSDERVVFALLLNKSAIGVYTS
ncbi:MAG TPA: response regulator [Terriglobales bacterium]|jgi:DNA-binding NtrC family response regulator